jgi:hypothetical protein
MSAHIEAAKQKITDLKENLGRIRLEWLLVLKQFAAQWVLDTAKREFAQAKLGTTVDPSSASAAKREVETFSQALVPGLVDEIAAAQRWWPHLDPKLPARGVYDKGGPEDGARHVLWNLYPLLSKYGLADPTVMKDAAQQGNRYPYFVDFPQSMQERLQFYFRMYDDLRAASNTLNHLEDERRQKEAESEWDKL